MHSVEAQLLAHDAGSVARTFLEQGFQRHPRLFMGLPLSKPPAQEAKRHPEGEIRPWSENEYQAAAAVITPAYRGHIDADITDQYHTLTASLRFPNNIVRFPGSGLFDAPA